MSSRFVLPFADVGNGITPSSGAKLFFFELDGVTPRNTFSNAANTVTNANPVISDANGLFGDIFLDGTYKVILQDKNSVQIWEASPVEGTSIANVDSHDTADAAAASVLVVGQTVQTLGRKTLGDGGAGLYEVVASGTGTDDGGAFINSNPSGSFQLKLITSRPNMIQWGVVEGGVTDNVTALQAFFDAQTGKCYGAPGEFLLSSVVTWPRYTEFEGSGYASQSNTAGTNFLHSGTGECFRNAATINESTSVNLKVSGFRVRKTVQASTKGAIVQIAGTFVDMSNIRIDTSGAFSFAYGIVFDQTEVATLTQINVEGMSIASFWFVNGDDYTPTSNPNFTNDVTMRNCSTNGGPTGILHDGGTGFKVIGGNTNGATTQGVRISGLNEWSLDTMFMEGGTGTADVVIEQTTSGGNSVGAGSSGTIANCRMASGVPNNILFNNASIGIAAMSIYGNLFGSGRSGPDADAYAIRVISPGSLTNSYIGPNTNLGGALKPYLHDDIYLSNNVANSPSGLQLEAKQITTQPGGIFSTAGSGKKVGVTAITTIVVGTTYVVLDTDQQIYATNTGGITTTLTLPTGLEHDGRELTVNQVAGSDPIVVDATTLSATGDSVTIRYDHTNTSWRVLSSVLNGVQTLTGAGAVDLVAKSTHIVTDGVNALTLADGVEGQEKFLVMKTDVGDGTLTPTNLGNGTTITFDDVGDSAHLRFTNSNWYFFGGTATLA